MSTETDTDDGYNSLELRQMDEQTARTTLTVAEYERWEQLHEMVDRAEQTRERWADEDEQVADIEVAAEMDQLGTEVDIYGNDLLVRLNPESEKLQAVKPRLEAYQSEVGDIQSGEDIDQLTEADAEELVSILLDLLDAVILKWRGTEWDSLAEHQRVSILETARSKWGIDGLANAWAEIIEAVERKQDDRRDVIESFRNPERRGDR